MSILPEVEDFSAIIFTKNMQNASNSSNRKRKATDQTPKQTPAKVKKQEKDTKMVALLKMVRENKDVLFSKFGPSGGEVTHESKMETWNRIRLECVREGYAELENKTAIDIRDKIYGNFKFRTLQKIDALKQSGADGQGQLSTVSQAIKAICFHMGILHCLKISQKATFYRLKSS